MIEAGDGAQEFALGSFACAWGTKEEDGVIAIGHEKAPLHYVWEWWVKNTFVYLYRFCREITNEASMGRKWKGISGVSVGEGFGVDACVFG